MTAIFPSPNASDAAIAPPPPARRGLRHITGNLSTLAGAAMVFLLLLAAASAPLFAPFDPNLQDLGARLEHTSLHHWLGTDQFGRDLLSRLLYGARPTLAVVTLVVVLSAPVGLAVGLAAGYLGGWVDIALMRLTDIVMSLPRLILALALVSVLRPGLSSAIIAIAVTGWPAYARLARAETLVLSRAEFVAAARGLGMSHRRIMISQILPLCLPSVAVRATLDMAGIILTSAGLGFLGLGAQPPLPEWGAMIAGGRDHILDAWWVAAVPGTAILLVSLGFNLLGDGLRDTLDPKQSD